MASTQEPSIPEMVVNHPSSSAISDAAASLIAVLPTRLQHQLTKRRLTGLLAALLTQLAKHLSFPLEDGPPSSGKNRTGSCPLTKTVLALARKMLPVLQACGSGPAPPLPVEAGPWERFLR